MYFKKIEENKTLKKSKKIYFLRNCSQNVFFFKNSRIW